MFLQVLKKEKGLITKKRKYWGALQDENLSIIQCNKIILILMWTGVHRKPLKCDKFPIYGKKNIESHNPET